MISIQPVVRQGLSLTLGIAGSSGSGKTKTALRVAWGLAKYDAKKIGHLNTEARRGSIHADGLVDQHGEVHRFNGATLESPFTPQRLRDCISAFEDFGTEVLIIDSWSDFWEGPGGYLDTTRNASHLRPRAKQDYTQAMMRLVQSPMHIILSLRMANKTKFDTGPDGKQIVTPLGLQPVADPDIAYSLTAYLRVEDRGRSVQELKASPTELAPIFTNRREPLTERDGYSLRLWADSGGAIELDAKKAKASLQVAASHGTAALTKAWESMIPEQRRFVEPSFRDECKATAAAVDTQRSGAASDESSDLNAALAAAVEDNASN